MASEEIKLNKKVYSFLLDEEQLRITLNTTNKTLNNSKLLSDISFSEKQYIQTPVQNNKHKINKIKLDTSVRMSKTNKHSSFTINMNIETNELINAYNMINTDGEHDTNDTHIINNNDKTITLKSKKSKNKKNKNNKKKTEENKIHNIKCEPIENELYQMLYNNKLLFDYDENSHR